MVDLPQPDGPSSVRNSRSSTVKLTFSTGVTPGAYVFVSLSTTTRAIPSDCCFVCLYGGGEWELYTRLGPVELRRWCGATECVCMSSPAATDSHLEIAHVLFIDIVGYSKLLIDQQTAFVKELNEKVRDT